MSDESSFDPGASRSIVIEIKPPVTTSFLRQKERDKRVVLLDIRADTERGNGFRIDLDIAFREVPIERGAIQKRDFYIGTTGGTVQLCLERGRILDNTGNVAINVSYSNEVSHTRQSSLKLSPVFKWKEQTTEVEAEFGALSFDAASEEKFVTSFVNAEHQLVATRLGDVISWRLDSPQAKKVIREFLVGNLYLYGTFHPPNGEIIGSVELRASEISFFDANKQRIDGANKSILMLFAVWRNGHSVPSKAPLKIEFREKRDA